MPLLYPLHRCLRAYKAQPLRWASMVLLPPIVHNEFARLPPHKLANRRKGHVEREDRLIAENLKLVLGP